MPMRSLKMKPGLPRHLEEALKQKWGFKVQKVVMMPNQYTLFAKPYVSDQDKGGNVIAPLVNNKVVELFQNKLTAYEQAALERRCDNIVSFFPDPYNSIMPVRTRLHNMSQTLSLVEQQYILEYMDENFPIDDKGK